MNRKQLNQILTDWGSKTFGAYEWKCNLKDYKKEKECFLSFDISELKKLVKLISDRTVSECAKQTDKSYKDRWKKDSQWLRRQAYKEVFEGLDKIIQPHSEDWCEKKDNPFYDLRQLDINDYEKLKKQCGIKWKT